MMESLASDLKGTPIGVSVFFPGQEQTSLGQNTDLTRPAHLRNEPGETPPLVGQGRGPRPSFDPSLFMSPEEIGRRVLQAIRRDDLFVMTHPEFRAGIVARNEALLRAIPTSRQSAPTRGDQMFGTLCFNP
jgi:short-subunit dehydrogenase